MHTKARREERARTNFRLGELRISGQRAFSVAVEVDLMRGNHAS